MSSWSAIIDDLATRMSSTSQSSAPPDAPLSTLEAKIMQLAQNILEKHCQADHMKAHPDLLFGWKAIAAYMQTPVRALQDYCAKHAFPATGRRRKVVTSKAAINAWILMGYHLSRVEVKFSGHANDH